MKSVVRIPLALVLLAGTTLPARAGRDQPFDHDWRFHRGDAPHAEHPDFDDREWRKLDLPHDWSIEDLPAHDASTPEQKGQPGQRIGPFDPRLSEGLDKTGYVVGGVGWYRKTFTTTAAGRRVAVRFDGVYMNADVWLNGRHLGNHPYGYTGFERELTPYLLPPGAENLLAVRVRNEGKNSRWYSGSGIYRHVWLTLTDNLHIPTWGVFVATPEINDGEATARVAVEVRNAGAARETAAVRVRVQDANGSVVGEAQQAIELDAAELRTFTCRVRMPSPSLWSPDAPHLYTAHVELLTAQRVIDSCTTSFGVRCVEIDAERGLVLNGNPLLLKGGCIHHDNGPLGAAAIDRAEARKIELLKANGFNAIRTSHNPPSPALLDACDRLGMLVVDEAFDQWHEQKLDNAQDYHRFFAEWYERDVAAMVRRDRNRPSVVMWSIGNEIPEQFRAVETQLKLREAVLAHDDTRPVTQAVCTDWGEVIKDWNRRSDSAFTHLDVAGYNYLPEKYDGDHRRSPRRVMYGSESFPKDCFAYWTLVEERPFVIGDFVWTAIDYLGESGLAHAVSSAELNPFFMSWPWHNAWCGDLDICGFKKPQSYYRDVVWRRSPIEMAVHRPMPSGADETLSWWGWPAEEQSWTWPGHEGTPLRVKVYTRSERVRLELNGEVVGEQPASAATNLTATFEVPYAQGTLRAVALDADQIVAETALETIGAPIALRLTADRDNLAASRNDLAYVTIEAVDDAGRRAPHFEAAVHFSVSGVGELAAQANGAPDRPASFQASSCTTFRGRCLAVIRPRGEAGEITLRAESPGLAPAEVTLHCE